MAVRNCKEIGENLQTIVKRLMANDSLVNLLYYSDADPLSQPHLTTEEKSKLIFNKLIKIVPRIEAREISQGIVVITVEDGTRLSSNQEFSTVKICLSVSIPLEQWLIKDTNLRPFAILGEIENSLRGKTINGLGKLDGGNFALDYLTDDVSVYKTFYSIVAYD